MSDGKRCAHIGVASREVAEHMGFELHDEAVVALIVMLEDGGCEVISFETISRASEFAVEFLPPGGRIYRAEDTPQELVDLVSGRIALH